MPVVADWLRVAGPMFPRSFQADHSKPRITFISALLLFCCYCFAPHRLLPRCRGACPVWSLTHRAPQYRRRQ